MAKHSRRHTRSRDFKRGGGNYSSASSYGTYVNGSVDSQIARTFDQTGPYANRYGTEYVGAQGQWAQEPGTPTEQNLSLIQSAGKSHKIKGGKSHKMGGKSHKMGGKSHKMGGKSHKMGGKSHKMGGKSHKRRYRH
jgi:hypothetical protein